MRSYAQALQRLALDTVDALIVHDLDAGFHGGETERHLKALDGGIKALDELKKAGQIKAIGCGINTSQALKQMVHRYDLDFCIVAMPYTLADQGGLDNGMDACVERGVSIIIGAPFASGILVRGRAPTRPTATPRRPRRSRPRFARSRRSATATTSRFRPRRCNSCSRIRRWCR